MTVEAQNPDGSPIVRSGPYLGNGVTTTFGYGFPILADHEVAVVRQNADLTEDTLKLTTDYTVTGVGNSSGGSVILNSGSLLPTGAKLVLLLSMAFDQTTAYSNQGRIKLELLEASLDKLTLACRQLLEQAQRAVNVDAFGTTDVATLRANITALAAIENQIVTVAGSIAGVNTVAGISTEVVQVAAVDNDVAALGPIAADITTVAGVDSDVTTVAGIAANVTAVAGISAAVSAVAGIAADVTTVATNIADVITNAANITDIQNAYDNAQDAINAAGAAAQSAVDAANAAAALNLSSFGLTLGGAADAAAARGILGLGTLATVSPTGTADATTRLAGDGTWKRDQVEASFEGESGAYRLRIGALQRLTAGDEIRSRTDGVQSGNGAKHTFAFLQVGSVRINFSHQGAVAQASTASIVRTRNSTSTTVATWTTPASTGWYARTADVDVLPGDLITIQNSGGASVQIRLIRIQTDGEDLFPAGSYPVEGNTYA